MTTTWAPGDRMSDIHRNPYTTVLFSFLEVCIPVCEYLMELDPDSVDGDVFYPWGCAMEWWPGGDPSPWRWLS